MLIVPIQRNWFSHVFAFKYALYKSSLNVHFIFIRFFLFVCSPAFFHSEHFHSNEMKPFDIIPNPIHIYFLVPHYIGTISAQRFINSLDTFEEKKTFFIYSNVSVCVLLFSVPIWLFAVNRQQQEQHQK